MILFYFEAETEDAGKIFTALAAEMPLVKNLRIETEKELSAKRIINPNKPPRSKNSGGLRKITLGLLEASPAKTISYETLQNTLENLGFSRMSDSPVVTALCKEGLAERLPGKLIRLVERKEA